MVAGYNINNLDRWNEYGMSASIKRFFLSSVRDSQPNEIREDVIITDISGNLELPRINRDYNMKNYTYTYGISYNEKLPVFDGITKVNVKTGKIKLIKK